MKHFIFLFTLLFFISCSEGDDTSPSLNSEFFIGTWQSFVMPDEPYQRPYFIFENERDLKFGYPENENIRYSSLFRWELNVVDRSFTIFNPESTYRILEYEQDKLVFTDSTDARYTIIRQ